MGRLLAVWQRDKMDNQGTTALFYTQDYDSSNRISAQGWQFGDGTSFSGSYTYNTNGTLKDYDTDFYKAEHIYDSLQRLVEVETDPAVASREYAYRDITDNAKTTMQVEALTYPALKGGYIFEYSYDSMGNISSYAINCPSNSGYNEAAFTYSYDNQNQLTHATDGTDTYSYTYDGAGNILSATKNGTTHSYTYGDADWKDLLTAYDGQAISYDGAGNPTSYYNGTRWNFTWGNGRRLETASNGTSNISYNYAADGIRTSKNVDGVTHTYYYSGTTLLRETYGDTVLDFFYDSDGNPAVLKQNGNLYYYITNLQGDVIRLSDINGNTAAYYEYDPYGNITKASGSHATINPLRYRGYYYDTETGLYYVSSRYYDPEIGRWINADIPETLAADFENFAQYNLFAYCFNDPVNMSDETGTWPSWAKKVVAAGAVVAVVAAVAVVTVATAGAGTAAAVIAVGTAKGAAIGMASGAAIGAATGAVSHRVSTGSWEGADKAALEGVGNGALSGAVTGAITGTASSVAKVSQAAKAWDSGTFKSGYQSMKYHYNEHVANEGLTKGTNVLKYTQDAVSFANRNSSVLKYTYNYNYGNASWNLTYSTGQGGMFTSAGKILTFWYR